MSIFITYQSHLRSINTYQANIGYFFGSIKDVYVYMHVCLFISIYLYFSNKDFMLPVKIFIKTSLRYIVFLYEKLAEI